MVSLSVLPAGDVAELEITGEKIRANPSDPTAIAHEPKNRCLVQLFMTASFRSSYGLQQLNVVGIRHEAYFSLRFFFPLKLATFTGVGMAGTLG